MKAFSRAIAAAELLLIPPASLFMAALFVREIQPRQYEPARTAAQLVAWYAVRPRLGLWIFLCALPMAALAIGGTTLMRSWRTDSELQLASRQMRDLIRGNFQTLLIAAATLAAAGVLSIVALHLISD
jgi:ABC-type Fe3+ transport system permease subunit